MKRLSIPPRPDWQERVEKVGLTFHTFQGQPYWDESACYQFEVSEINELESATAELQRLCLEAAQFIIDKDRFDDLGIPNAARAIVVQAWNAEPPSIYGRFDLAYDGTSPPKLLEYNANTPTSLLEASVVQWYWRQEVFPATDQFNSLHEKLIAKWRDLKRHLRGAKLYFTSMEAEEDLRTIVYLRDTAEQAGIRTEQLTVREIGWNAATETFRDLHEQSIESLFSLYPWEWLLSDFAQPILQSYPRMDWIEPIWKMMWSNKAILAILWELFPGHPNLLPAYLDSPRELREYVSKPLLSREGANVTVHLTAGEVSTTGPYDGPVMYQQFAGANSFDNQIPVIGSWYITDQGPAGIGIREAPLITTNTSRFVPHFFL
jgi:glutathionylspermidine synthase